MLLLHDSTLAFSLKVVNVTYRAVTVKVLRLINYLITGLLHYASIYAVFLTLAVLSELKSS